MEWMVSNIVLKRHEYYVIIVSVVILLPVLTATFYISLDNIVVWIGAWKMEDKWSWTNGNVLNYNKTTIHLNL